MLREDFNLVNAILWVWAIISVCGFLLIGWHYLESQVFQNGVNAGFEQGVSQGAAQASGQIYTDIINKAANNECNTVFVQYEGRRVDLVNVQCLQVQEPATGEVQDTTVPNS